MAALELFGGDVSTLIVVVEGEPDFERDLIMRHLAVFAAKRVYRLA